MPARYRRLALNGAEQPGIVEIGAVSGCDSGAGIARPRCVRYVAADFTAHIAFAALQAAWEKRSASSDFSAFAALSMSASTSLLLSVIGF
jgi:hypothetical protein